VQYPLPRVDPASDPRKRELDIDGIAAACQPLAARYFSSMEDKQA
jgi:hypothetical protein